MVENHRGSDPLFCTSKRTILEIWDIMQRVQVDFAFAQELSFYYTSPEWHKAQTVLDVGTGNGYYLAKLANRFADKHYHGIDSSGELVAIASHEAHPPFVSFTACDLATMEGQYDFVLARLLLQHLDDIPCALDKFASLTRAGGSLLIIDSHDAYRFFSPDLPEFKEFFAAYTAHELVAGRNRKVSQQTDLAIAASSVWRKHATLDLLIPSTLAGNMDLFTKTYTLFIDLVEQAGEMNYDFAKVKESWIKWAMNPNAYTQVGLTLTQLKRF